MNNTFVPSGFSMEGLVAQASQFAATTGAQQSAAQLEAQRLQKQTNTANIVSSVTGLFTTGLGLFKKPSTAVMQVPQQQQQQMPQATGTNYMLVGGIAIAGILAVGTLVYVVTKD